MTQWKLVPVEPTKEMLHVTGDGPNTSARIYRDMLSAAPSTKTLRKLVFTNADAKPISVVINCDEESVPHVMAWYGAFFAGDRYTVALDGRNVRMDMNGAPIGKLP